MFGYGYPFWRRVRWWGRLRDRPSPDGRQQVTGFVLGGMVAAICW